VFSALDFLAEVMQHIPEKGEHLLRYSPCLSPKVVRSSQRFSTPTPRIQKESGGLNRLIEQLQELRTIFGLKRSWSPP
jgi:hypothetical protein